MHRFKLSIRRRGKLQGHALVAMLAAVLAGCLPPIPGPHDRLALADRLAAKAGWQGEHLDTGDLVLMTYLPGKITDVQTLTIYIEGDGLSWRTHSHPSANPTPVDPVGLKLALSQQRHASAYLARPCQYISNDNTGHCTDSLWTNARYSEAVITASNRAIGLLKSRFGANQLQLVGYSGGGAVAALVAARRTDVVRLITVAGNLDHAMWTRLHGLTPLDRSLNPAEHWRALADIEQIHFVGGLDGNVGAAVAESYRSRFPAGNRPVIRQIDEFDHHCCWVEYWQTLLEQQVR